jgi:hypothetical protein
MSAKMRAWGKTFGDRMAANPKRLAANRRNAADPVWLAERRATAKRVGATPEFREACKAGALKRPRMKRPRMKRSHHKTVRSLVNTSVRGHIAQFCAKPVSTRAAPRGKLIGRARGSVPSFYDRAHPQVKIVSPHDTPERRADAKKLLDDRQRGMLKGYWSSDSNPLNWKYAS